mmetsp:Transcript_1385/g.2578  ORF Transcript_1385/g.2578 Transcript_1385/m.2578 type:complete len:80 (+) Transcript_1385:56-295(+)
MKQLWVGNETKGRRHFSENKMIFTVIIKNKSSKIESLPLSEERYRLLGRRRRFIHTLELFKLSLLTFAFAPDIMAAFTP